MARTIYLVISLVLGAFGGYVLLMLLFGDVSIPVGAAGGIAAIFVASVAALANALAAIVVFFVLGARAKRRGRERVVELEDADSPDVAALHELNQANAPAVGSVDLDRMRRLVGMPGWCLLVLIDDQVAGYLVAMTPDADYDSPNFTWFKERYDDFAYIDRVAIAAPHRRRGLGTRLYREIEQRAAVRGIPRIACEYNLRPPNPVSAAFHRRRGFEEVGIQDTEQGTKTVSLQLKSLGDG